MNSPAAATCPLCLERRPRLIEQVSARELERAYKRKVDVSIQIPVAILDYLECCGCGLLFFMPAMTGEAEFYAQLRRHAWYYPAHKHEFEIAKRYIEPDASVLEVGAGGGHFGAGLSSQRYVGLELSTAAIEEARQRGVSIRQESIEAHAELHAGAYDVVCSFQVLEHVADPRGFLAAAAACVRSGGLLIVGVPAEDSFAAHDYWQILNMPPHHVTRWRDRTLRMLANILQLELVELTHETLPDSDLLAYGTALANAAYATRRGRAPRLLDPTLDRPLVRARSRRIAKLLAHAFKLQEFRPRGQAVVAVMRKPNRTL